MMAARSLVLVACFAAAGVLVHSARRAEAHVARQPLTAVPLAIDRWIGRASPALDSRVLAALGSDEYVDRVYVADRDVPLGLFVGYYATQRQGDTMHSPLNCLPGDGWTPVTHTTIEIPRGAGAVARVNRYVIEKGAERQLVLYWYQGRGRIVAGEYAAKAYLVLDAIRRSRTDGALVRVISPITGAGADAERSAEGRAVAFATAMLPMLAPSLPS
jgi:EpsI family protein